MTVSRPSHSRPSRLRRASAFYLSSLAVAVFAAACTDSPAGPGPGDQPGPTGDVAAGRVAFVESCAGCHNSGDGLDLAHFGYPDSTIVRRAVAHVTDRTARDIAAYIRSLGPAASDRRERLFQPEGRVLAGDVDLAMELFGADAWPSDLTDDALAAIDPLDVPVPLALPAWSVEGSAFDWIPDEPISDAVLDWDPASPVLRPARVYLTDYYDGHRFRDLELALKALRASSHDDRNSDAPCVRTGGDVDRIRTCFEARRWMASLAAQHTFREARGWAVPQSFHSIWWEVGDGLSRGLPPEGPAVVDDPNTAAAWLHLSWMFAPGDARQQVYYPTDALAEAGFPRLAVFHSLRSMVAREPGHRIAYADLEEAAQHAPAHWTYAVVKLGLTHLTARVDRGDWPSDLAYPRGHLLGALGQARQKISDPTLIADLENIWRPLDQRIAQRAGL